MNPQTQELTRWWTDTHQEIQAAQAMWDAWTQPHREQSLAMALHCLGPVQSVYELGCGSGPNLRLLKEKYPQPLTLGGSEPCEGMASFASEHLDIPIDREPLPAIPRGQWDVVFSCYTLAYIHPEDVIRVCKELAKSQTRALILIEPQPSHAQGVGLYSRGPQVIPDWFHNYPLILANTGWTITWRWPVIPPIQALNGVLIAERPTHVPVAEAPSRVVSPLGAPPVAGTPLILA